MKNRSSSPASRRTRPLAALTLLLAAGAAQAQTPASFAPVIAYPTGADSNPLRIVVADMNGDGRPDIVTANNGTSTAGVLLGQAGGSFAPISVYSTGVGGFPQGIAVADLNGDGRPDIVTANRVTNTVGVLLAQVGGGFAAVSTYALGAGSGPQSIAVADMNGDGRPDLVTVNVFTNTASILLGQAGGGFAAPTNFPTGGSTSTSIALTDVNGDGRLDLVTANRSSNTASVLLGQVGGGFAAPTTYSTGSNSQPFAIAVADVNGDGRPDIVTANNGSLTAGVLLGQAGGGFAAVSTFSMPFGAPLSVAVADVNGDGRPDLVTANDPGTAGVLLGQAGGGFAAASSYRTDATGPSFGVALADLNGDGRPDLATTNYISNTVGVLLNTGTFTPLAAAPATAAAEVALFPNPAHTGFAVRLPAAWSAAPVRAELRNALGQVVAVRSAALAGGAALQFATEGLAPGVYVLRVQAGVHTVNKRVVVE